MVQNSPRAEGRVPYGVGIRVRCFSRDVLHFASLPSISKSLLDEMVGSAPHGVREVQVPSLFWPAKLCKG